MSQINQTLAEMKQIYGFKDIRYSFEGSAKDGKYFYEIDLTSDQAFKFLNHTRGANPVELKNLRLSAEMFVSSKEMNPCVDTSVLQYSDEKLLFTGLLPVLRVILSRVYG